jgi:hypothetical protein
MEQPCEKLKSFFRQRFLVKESEKFCKYILEKTTLSEEEIQKIEFSEFLNYFNPKEEFDEKELENFFDKLMSVPSSLATFLEKNSRLDEFYEMASFIVQIKNLDLDDIINMNEEDFQRINEGMDKKKWEELYQFVQPQTSVDSPLYQEIEKILPNEIKETHRSVINEIKKNYVAKSLYELELDDFPEIQKEQMSSFITSVDLLIYKDPLSELLHKYGVFQEYKKLVFALNQSGVDFKNLLNDPNCSIKILKEKFLMGEIVEEFTSILNFLSIFKDNSNHDIVLKYIFKKKINFSIVTEFAKYGGNDLLFLIYKCKSFDSLVIISEYFIKNKIRLNNLDTLDIEKSEENIDPKLVKILKYMIQVNKIFEKGLFLDLTDSLLEYIASNEISLEEINSADKNYFMKNLNIKEEESNNILDFLKQTNDSETSSKISLFEKTLIEGLRDANYYIEQLENFLLSKDFSGFKITLNELFQIFPEEAYKYFLNVVKSNNFNEDILPDLRYLVSLDDKNNFYEKVKSNFNEEELSTLKNLEILIENLDSLKLDLYGSFKQLSKDASYSTIKKFYEIFKSQFEMIWIIKKSGDLEKFADNENFFNIVKYQSFEKTQHEKTKSIKTDLLNLKDQNLSLFDRIIYLYPDLLNYLEEKEETEVENTEFDVEPSEEVLKKIEEEILEICNANSKLLIKAKKFVKKLDDIDELVENFTSSFNTAKREDFIKLLEVIKNNSKYLFNVFPEFLKILTLPSKGKDLLMRIYERIKFDFDNIEDEKEEIIPILKDISDRDTKLLSQIYLAIPDIEKIFPRPKHISDFIKEEIRKINDILNNRRCLPYSIADMMEIDSSSDLEKLKEDIISKFKSHQLESDFIVKLFFDSIKRKESINEKFREIKRELDDFPINQFNLLKFILENSESSLRIVLLNVCIKFMPIPLYIANIEADKPSIENLEEIHRKRSDSKSSNNKEIAKITNTSNSYLELCYLFEDSCSNMISFCITNETIKYPKGKSFLLNTCFGRSFLNNEKEISKYGNIEINFDYHFANPLSLNIADYHGYPDWKVLEAIIPLCNYYLIHINEYELSEIKEIFDNYFEKVKSHHGKEFLFIIIIHDNKYSKIVIDHDQSGPNKYVIKFKELRQANQEELKNLKDEIWKNTNPNNLKRINGCPEKFLKFSESLNKNDSTQVFREKFKNVEKCLHEVLKYKNNFTNPEFLPFNHSFVEYSDERKNLQANYHEYNTITLKKKVEYSEKLDEKISKQKYKNIVPLFYALVDDEHFFMGNLMKFSIMLKQKIEDGLIEPYKKRQEISQKLSQKFEKEEDKIKLEEEMKKNFQVIKEKSFSYEYVVRELYQIWRKKDRKDKETQYFVSLSSKLIESGSPFEVIDGDNLHFVSNFYSQYFKNDNSRTFILSIMGPQSSGKSTLLNFLFGTQFASSSGRCTKGVYGSTMKIKNHPKYDQILILDTEGILSAERNDRIFDRKLFLFCLLISNATIICNKGDINKEMNEVLKLAITCMRDLKLERKTTPNVYIVLNALTDINKQKLWEPINQLQKDLFSKEVKSGTDVNDVIELTEENVIMLPFAFESIDVYKNIKANIPSNSFSLECLNFRNKILNNNKKDGERLSYWFQLAQKIWESVDQLRNLIDYTNIEELAQDRKLSELITNLGDQFKNEIKNKINFENIAKEILKTFRIEDSENHFRNARQKLDSEFFKLNDEYGKRYDKECEVRNIEIRLFKKRKILLENNFTVTKGDLDLELQSILNKIKINASKAGDNLLKEKTNSLLQENNNNPYTKEQSEILFEIFWRNTIMEKLLKDIPDFEKKSEECFHVIRKNYECFSDKLLSNANLEYDIKYLLPKSNSKDLENIFINYEEEKLLFIEKAIPNIEQILKYQNFKGKFIEIPNLFKTEENYLIKQLDVKKAIKTSFINSHLLSIITKIWEGEWNRWRITTARDNFTNFFKIIANECNKLNLNFEYEDSYIEYWAKIFKYDIEEKSKTLEIAKTYVKNHVSIEFINQISKKISMKDIGKVLSYSSSSDMFQSDVLYDSKYMSKNEFESSKQKLNNYYFDKSINHSPDNKFDKNTRDFLHWYLNGDYNKLIPARKIAGIKLYESFIKWDVIVDSIILECYNAFTKSSNTKEVNLFEEMRKILDAAKNSTDISKSLEIFSDFDSIVISNLTKQINNLINSLNTELKPLNFEMNQILIGMFHELAMLVTWYIHSCLEYYKCFEHVRLNQNEKSKMKDLFVSILTNDVGSADKLISTKIFDTIQTYLNDQAFSKAKRVFDEEVKKYEQDFEPHHTMQYLDNMLKSEETKEIIEVIISPEKVLENLFNNKWKELEKSAVENSQKTWLTIVSNKWESLEKYFNDFYENLKNSKLLMPSINMFTFANFSGENQEGYLQLAEENKLQTFVCKYLMSSLKGDWQNLKENCGNYEIVSNFPTIKPLYDEDILNILTQALEGMKIGNLGVVIHSILEIVRENLKNLNKNIPGYSLLDSSGLQKDFKNKYIGCNVHCGLCGRKCDENHTPQKVNHKCLSGHRFKVYGGSKIDKSNFPSFISCNEMKDDNKVQHNGKLYINNLNTFRKRNDLG